MRYLTVLLVSSLAFGCTTAAPGPYSERPVYCVNNSLEIVDGSDGDAIVARGGNVQAVAWVKNCGGHREAVRSDLFVLDEHQHQLGQLRYTAVLRAGEAQQVNRLFRIPSGSPTAVVCYLLISQAVNAPLAQVLSDPECIRIVDR